MASEAQRHTMGEAMDLLVHHRAHVPYLQHRPMGSRSIHTLDELRKALEHELPLDCSESATLICHVAGIKNPSGFGYPTGAGNTQTMYDHLPHYLNPRQAGLGALVFFGWPNRLGTQHVCVVRHPGEDPELFSHGGNGAFAAHFLPFSVERRYHVGSPVFLSISHL